MLGDIWTPLPNTMKSIINKNVILIFFFPQISLFWGYWKTTQLHRPYKWDSFQDWLEEVDTKNKNTSSATYEFTLLFLKFCDNFEIEWKMRNKRFQTNGIKSNVHDKMVVLNVFYLPCIAKLKLTLLNFFWFKLLLYVAFTFLICRI